MLNFLKNRIFKIHTLMRGLCVLDQPTFQKIIANIEREHFRNNATISHYRYGWFRSLLDWMGKNFRSTLVIIIFIYAGFSLLLHLVNPSFLNLKENFIAKLPEINLGLLSTQAVLAAIIYPLMIALAGILFEVRTAVSGDFRVFLKETEAIPTGISALLFCMTLALQFLIGNFISSYALFSFFILNIIWFVSNILALCFFLYRSIEYIRDDGREEFLYSYTVNVVWRVESKKIIERCYDNSVLNDSMQYSLNWAQKFFIQISYIFCSSSSKKSMPLTIKKLLKGRANQLISLVDTGNLYEFEDQLSRLKEFHIFLFKIAEADMEGKKFNYAQQLSPLSPSIFNETVGIIWAKQYRELFKCVVSRLLEEPEFFSYCAYLSSHLYAEASKVAQPDALESINDIAFHLFYRLNEWRPTAQLSPREKKTYNRVWRDFVAGWENLSFEISISSPGHFQKNHISELTWDELSSSFKSLQRHLSDTLKMVALSSWSQHKVAVNWSADILIRWYKTIENFYSPGGTQSWVLKKHLITTEVLKKIGLKLIFHISSDQLLRLKFLVLLLKIYGKIFGFY